MTLALENLNPVPDVIKIGDSRAEVLHIVREIEHPNLGICWDIGHDVAAGRVEAPGPVWLRQVRHVHIHDLDDAGQDHFPLIYGRVQPERWLPPVIRAGFDGIVTLELNGRRCAFLWPDQIMPALVNSIRAIASAIRPPRGGTEYLPPKGGTEYLGVEQTPGPRQSGTGEDRA